MGTDWILTEAAIYIFQTAESRELMTICVCRRETRLIRWRTYILQTVLSLLSAREYESD